MSKGRRGAAEIRWPRPALGPALGVLLAASGCAIPTRVGAISPEIPRQMTPAAVDAGLTALDDPKTRAQIQHLLMSPQTREMQRELIEGVVDGSLAVMSDEGRVERAGALSSRYLAGMIQGVARQGGPGIGAAASAVMSGALSEANARAVARFLAAVVDESVQPIAQRLSGATIPERVARATTEQVGPALEEVLARNVGPGLAEAMGDARVADSLGGVARVLGREMVLGANEAMKEMQADAPVESQSLLGRLGILASKGAKLATWATWVAVAAAVALGAWSLKLFMSTRRYRSEIAEREATTRLLHEAMSAAEGKPWSGELLAALEERFKADQEALLQLRAARGRGHSKRAPRRPDRLTLRGRALRLRRR